VTRSSNTLSDRGKIRHGLNFTFQTQRKLCGRGGAVMNAVISNISLYNTHYQNSRLVTT